MLFEKSTFSIRVTFTVSTMHRKNKCYFDTRLCHLQVPKITLLFIGTINIFWDIQWLCHLNVPKNNHYIWDIHRLFLQCALLHI